MSNDIYRANGYDDREDYLSCLAEDYGVDLDTVKALADLQEELLDASVYVEAMQGRLIAAEALIRLLRSYNPDLPMGPGMKAQFLALREVLDV